MGSVALILVASLIGMVIGIVLRAIRINSACSNARKLLKQAEDAENSDDLKAAIERYKDLILAVARNEAEVPMWLERLEAIYKKLGADANTVGVLAAHKAILDIWSSKLPDSEKSRLHREAMQGLTTQLNALP